MRIADGGKELKAVLTSFKQAIGSPIVGKIERIKFIK